MEEEDEEETKEDISSEESSMNQFDASEEKLLAKHGRSHFFGDDSDTHCRRSHAPRHAVQLHALHPQWQR
jgi:hypothetical protein